MTQRRKALKQSTSLSLRPGRFVCPIVSLSLLDLFGSGVPSRLLAIVCWWIVFFLFWWWWLPVVETNFADDDGQQLIFRLKTEEFVHDAKVNADKFGHEVRQKAEK